MADAVAAGRLGRAVTDPGVPDEIVERVLRVSDALPEVTMRTDKWAHAFEVRNRPVAFLFYVDAVAALVLNAEPDEIDALVAGGHPYFKPRGGARNRVGVVLDDATHWDEVA